MFHIHNMASKENTVLIGVSKFISNFFNPLTSLFLYLVYYNVTNFTLKKGLQNFLELILLLLVPIIIWIFVNVKKGNYTNMDVSNRHQRKSLYFFIAALLGGYLAVNYFLHDVVDLRILFIGILLLAMQFSNYFIKSSMHTSFNIFVAALFFVQNPWLGFIWFLLSILIGITRVILKRHTTKEVISGGLIAILVSIVYIFVYISSHYQA